MKTKKKKVHKIQKLRKTKNRMHCEVSRVVGGLENPRRQIVANFESVFVRLYFKSNQKSSVSFEFGEPR